MGVTPDQDLCLRNDPTDRSAHAGAPATLSTDVPEAQKAERLRLALSTLLSTCSGKTPEFNQVRFQTELLQAIPPLLEEPICISPHAVTIFPVGVPLGNDLVEWVVVRRSQSVARNQPKILLHDHLTQGF